MATFLRLPVVGVSWLVVFAVGLCAPLGAAAQQPATDPPASLDRIREELTKDPSTRLKLDAAFPVATFKSGVEERVWVPPFQEWLESQFKLNTFGRQGQAWASWCCGGMVFATSLPNGAAIGINLDVLFKALDDRLKRRQLRKIREQIARELAELDAAKNKADLPDKQ